MNKKTILLLFVLVGLLSACGSQLAPEAAAGFETPLPNQVDRHQDGDYAGHNHVHLDQADATAELKVVLVPSELVVGPNRFAVGLFGAEGHMIDNGLIHFHYFDLSDPEAPVLESEADATPLQTPDGLTTIFVHERVFDRAGDWGVEVQARLSDGATAVKRISFQVLADSPTLNPGELAPALDTPTVAEVNGDLDQLTSALEPNPTFYQLNLAEALASGKPTVLLFATPAFCQTRFCGPAYEQASELQSRYGDNFNFIQVEVYTGLPNPAANNWEVAPAMLAFGLTTEPWLYLIDADGKIVYRVEGMFTTTEVERHLLQILSGA